MFNAERSKNMSNTVSPQIERRPRRSRLRVARLRSYSHTFYHNALNATPIDHVNRPQYVLRSNESAFAQKHILITDFRR